ncbi:MAG: hypothetical protein JNL92_20220 [Opitutaceae bacterium]|nr:hypothetical protein [Opitutaceae bacterium]
MTRIPSALYRLLARFVLSVLAGLVTVSPAVAQSSSEERAELIEAIYPIMIAALEAKQFGRARNICDQVILWEPQNPVHHYNLACIEAQAGGSRLPYALGALELAAALGFDDPGHLRTDPDLKPLHGEARFAEIARRVEHNANASDAISGLAFPSGRPAPSAGTASEPDNERPAAASFQAGRPVGLYWMNRYHSATRALEKSVWYFAPDGTVYRNLQHGYSGAELAAHKGPRGTASLSDRTLHIRWADGAVSAGPLERDRTGFTWDMGIFSAVERFGDASELPGVYSGNGDGVAETRPAVVPQRLTLRADGSFLWEGVSFLPPQGSGPVQIAAATEPTTGRWELREFSLTLTADSGVVVRRFAFPDDDRRTVVNPDRLFFGGMILKRQP